MHHASMFTGATFFEIAVYMYAHLLVDVKGLSKYLLMPLLGKNQLAITLHMYASIGPDLDNTHRGKI